MIIENPYRIKHKPMIFFRYGGIAAALAGLLFLVISLIPDSPHWIKEGNWCYIPLASFSSYLYIIGRANLKLEKCFISFCDDTIRYRLMKDKTEKAIRLDDIRSVVVEILRIRIQLTASSEMIYLGNLKDSEMHTIKEKFEEIGRKIGK